LSLDDISGLSNDAIAGWMNQADIFLKQQLYVAPRSRVGSIGKWPSASSLPLLEVMLWLVADRLEGLLFRGTIMKR
jgi:hypothetical protein